MLRKHLKLCSKSWQTSKSLTLTCILSIACLSGSEAYVGFETAFFFFYFSATLKCKFSFIAFFPV